MTTATVTVYSIPIDLPEMVDIPGTAGYTMGSVSVGGTATTEHTVPLSAFRMAKYEVTYELWYHVKEWAMNVSPSSYWVTVGRQGTGVSGGAPGVNAQHPVTEVSWRDSIAWCNALSEMAGLTPIYYNAGAAHTTANVYRNSSTVVDIANTDVEWTANGYRLPTEAQWEYAARNKGTSSGDQHAGYEVDPTIDNCAWYGVNAGSETHPVGGKTPNSLGLRDMSGNVWEWCWDWYEAVYVDGPPFTDLDSKGPPSALKRCRRGGSWTNGAAQMATSYRSFESPDDKSQYLGLRLALPALR